MKYHFFYDETEHSRKINIATISAPNYYDNFIVTILGWKEADEQGIKDSYLKFEEKYAARKSKGELKSQTLRQEQFTHGFASLNKPNIEFVNDFLSLFDQKIHLYFAIASKIEFVVTQVLDQYRNSIFFDMDAVKYSITKAICLYRPTEILEHTFRDTAEFVKALQSFLLSRIKENRGNLALKESESKAFQNILAIISNAHDPKTIEWSYDFAFLGFNKYLKECSISDIELFLDKEGKNGVDSRTLKAAKRMGISEAQEVNTKECIGVRFSDIFVGIIAKLMKAISNELSYSKIDNPLDKKILSSDWFRLTESQLSLYKKLRFVICELNNAWYKSFAGNYSDDLISFIALLNYMDHFSSVDEIADIEKQGEYFNSFCCECLSDHFTKMRNKLPVEPIPHDDREFFLNERGAKVFLDIRKQPVLLIPDGSKDYFVLSVGADKKGNPFVTVDEGGKAICYKLPPQLYEWAMTVVGFSAAGEQIFPTKVRFSKVRGRFFADIL